MGIRVRKVIGYGLTDFRGARDTRLRADRLKWDEADRWGAEAFLEWVKAHRRDLEDAEYAEWKSGEAGVGLFEMALEDRLRDRPGWMVWDSVFFDSEFGDPRTVVFVPPDSVGWQRYNDVIDWLEEGSSTNGPRVRKKVFKNRSGIYPFDGFMVRYRDPRPEVVADAWPSWVQRAVRLDDAGRPVRMTGQAYNRLVGRWARGQPPLAEEPFLTHLVEDWRPPVPLGIIALLRFAGMAHDERAVLDALRPMLYVYWS